MLNWFLVALFLRNSDQGRFGNLVFKYQEAFAGNEDKYPADVKTMLDNMRSQPKRNKKKKNGDKNGDNNGKRNEDPSKESSFAQCNKVYTCFCCGNKECNFRDCTKKATLPKEQWHDPSKYKNSYRQQVNNQNVDKSEREYKVSFNHAQRHAEMIDQGEDDEEILDSGSTVSLMKGGE